MVTRNRLNVGTASVSPPATPVEGNVRAWDDFVPVGDYCPLDYSECSETHDYEREIQRRLLEMPGLHFTSLVVRRLENGICVQGVLETSGPHLDIGKIIRDLSGAENVVNQVLIRECPGVVIEC